MKLAIVTINYNGADKTIRLLESMRDQTDQDFQIIVVDNASSDDDLAQIYSAVRQMQGRDLGRASVEIIRNDQNLGFSGGNNLGIQKALQNGVNWVLLVNNDTWAKESFIRAIKANLEHLKGVIGTPLNEGSQVAYGGLVRWLRSTLPHVYDKNQISEAIPAKRAPSPDNLKSQIYAIGGGMLIHKSVFEKIGMLDERYFLYFEDADFCQRARRASIPINILPEVQLNHEVSSTTQKLGSPLLLRYHFRNAHLFNRKNGPWHIKFALPFWSFFIIVKQILKLALGIKKEESLAIIKGVMDFYLNRFGKIL